MLYNIKENKSMNKKELSDSDIVKSILDGDTTLYSEIVERYQKKVLIMTQRYVYDNDDADDLVQEIFIKIYDKLNKFKFKSSLGTWIYRVAVNHCLEYIRKRDRKRQLKLVKTEEHIIKNVRSENPTPEEHYESRELRKKILKIIDDNLSVKQKSVFLMKYFDEMPVKDIAFVLDMSEGTVKTHLSRSYGKIKDKLRRLINE